MTRRLGLAAAAFLVAVIALSLLTLRDGALRRVVPRQATSPKHGSGVREAAALARLQAIPFYRALTRSDALIAARLDRDGTVHLDVDLHALAEARLKPLGLAALAEMFPASAQGTIALAGTAASGAPAQVWETWLIPGPAPLLEILDRTPAPHASSAAGEAVPGTPSAVIRAELLPGCLTDPAFGGEALDPWRDRAEFAEKLLGRPVRRELAEDLAGPLVFALYDTADGTEADALAAVELRRADRVAGLLDTLFGLGALTERATILRYRGVATGSFVGEAGGPGLAAAVDGPVLILATSRARLESAIDARRQAAGRNPGAGLPAAGFASWSAESRSAFVANGWCRLARCGADSAPPAATTTAALRPEGRFDWRFEGHGPGPAITADAIVPFVRTLWGKRQRDGG